MIKNGVRLHGVVPQMFYAANVAEKVWLEQGFSHFAITSGIEGKHKHSSQHWEGHALDFRTWLDKNGTQMTKLQRDSLGRALRRALSDEYVVVVEGNHIHVHWKGLKAS